MEKDQTLYNGELTGTIDQKNKMKNNRAQSNAVDSDFGASLDGIQQSLRVNPADEEDYKGTIGYKDA